MESRIEGLNKEFSGSANKDVERIDANSYLFHRSQKWAAIREEKLRKAREKSANEAEEELTFRPLIKPMFISH